MPLFIIRPDDKILNKVEMISYCTLHEFPSIVEKYEFYLNQIVGLNLSKVILPTITPNEYDQVKKVIVDFLYEHDEDISIYQIVDPWINKVLTNVSKHRRPVPKFIDILFKNKSLPKYENLEMKDTSFSFELSKLMKEKECKEKDLYKNSNMSKEAFYTIFNSNNNPSKAIVTSLCIGLRLNYEESAKLLDRAGYTLCFNDNWDRIIVKNIRNKNYNIYTINEELFSNGLLLLGSF